MKNLVLKLTIYKRKRKSWLVVTVKTVQYITKEVQKYLGTVTGNIKCGRDYYNISKVNEQVKETSL